jgi:hypothetical protein
MRYSEAGRTVFVDSEVMNEPDTMLAYSSSITKWDLPHESEPLDDNARTRIVENIKRVFELKGYKLHIV